MKGVKGAFKKLCISNVFYASHSTKMVWCGNLVIAVDSNVKAILIAIQVATKFDTVFFCA